MKIFSISRIKNEEDIIESFIRYHLNFIDGMVIIEDYSNDKTYDILQKLKNENLPIHIYRNSKQPIPQEEVINNAFNIALNDFSADLIIPLDCDEFLVCKNGGNPRDILENLHEDRYYQVFWRTYLPNLDEKSFSLNNLKTIRDPFLDDRSKIIIPAKLTENYEVTITPGAHSVENKDILFEELYELRIAHIPIRNKIQCISKEIIGWLNNISHYYKDPRSSWHQNIMYRMLIDSNGMLTDEQMYNYAKSYSSRKSLDMPIKEYDCEFDTSFCENIELKYTSPYNLNGFKKILDYAENPALNYAKTNQILTDVNEDILNNNNAESNYLYALEDAYTHVKKQLYFKENEFILKSKKFTGNIEVRNDKIRELKGKILEKNNKINEVNQQKSEKQVTIKELKREINKLKKDNEKLTNHNTKLNNENIELKSKNKELNKLTEDILNSNSWKITKPLRKLK